MHSTDSRTPDSVLVSLRRLREIEQQRTQRELDQRQQEELERLQAAEAAARRERERDEARARDEDEQRRREEEQRDRQEREERLRIEEARQRARVEADLQLERERLRLELAARPPQRSLAAWIPPLLAVALAGGALFFGWEWRGEVSRRRGLEAQLERAGEESAQRTRLLEQSEAQLARRGQQLASLRLEADELRRRLREAPTARPGDPPHRPTRPPVKPRPPTSVIPAACKDSTDPIGCLEDRGRRL
jgi:hypothetical protein